MTWLARGLAWRAGAICRDTDPDLWFSDHPADQREALRICKSCPVRSACLDDALAHEGGIGTAGRYGIVGGRTPEGRRGEYRKRLAATGGGTQGARHGGARHRAQCGTEAAKKRHRRLGEACDRCNTPQPTVQPTDRNRNRSAA